MPLRKLKGQLYPSIYDGVFHVETAADGKDAITKYVRFLPNPK